MRQDVEAKPVSPHLLPSFPDSPPPCSVVLDEAEVSVIMRIMRQNVEAQLRNPTFRYSNRVREINYGSCYYFVPTTLEVCRQGRVGDGETSERSSNGGWCHMVAAPR